MDFFNKLTGKDDKKKKPIKNPFANVGKALQGNRRFEGSGTSLGGSKPGKLIRFELAEPGPLGMKVSRGGLIAKRVGREAFSLTHSHTHSLPD